MMKWRFALSLAVLGLMWLIQREHNSSAKAQTIPIAPPAAAAVETAKSEPPPPPVQTEGNSSYQQLLENDRFCEAARVNIQQEDHRQQFLRSLGLDMDPRYRELAQANSPYFSDPSHQMYSTPIARFLQALRLGGILVGAGEASVHDLNGAWDLLKQLQHEDPSNAAYALFGLVIGHDLQRPPEEMHELALALFNASHMDSLYTDFAREIFQRMQANATKFTAGMAFLAALPMPDYQAVKQIVADLDVDFPGLAKALARLMVEPGLAAGGSSVHWAYNALEYSVGRLLAPEIEAPPFSELDRNRRDTSIRWQRLADLDERTWIACEPETRERLSSEAQDWVPL